MPSYAQYMEEIARLHALAAAVKQDEAEHAKKQIRDIMQKHGLTLADLRETKRVRKPVAPKYRDPVSGKTWTGRGRTPTWLQGQSRDKFKI